jgi:hypothetical protein
MPNIKFSELDVSPDLSELDYIVGVRYNEETELYENYTYQAKSFVEIGRAHV